MADTLCGPSNALQSFGKHTQLDRTLQQDRLVAPRYSPAQGFRSHDPRTGSLDAEFHAFENAQPNPLQFQQPLDFGAFQHPSAPAAWAADFQRLHISQPPTPVPASQFRTEAPLIKTSSAAWNNDFLGQSGAVTPLTMQTKGKEAVRMSTPIPAQDYAMSQQNQGLYMQPHMYTGVGAGNIMLNQQSQHPYLQEQGHDHGPLSDQAFEQAFQEAVLAEAHVLQQQQPSPILQAEHPSESDLAKSDIRIGSDAISYTEMKDRTVDQDTHDADELAHTAGQLLNLVQHDTSEKFQNSQFLGLMRKLRDREVEVQNNDMISTAASTINTTAGTSFDTNTAKVEQHQDLNSYPAATSSDYSFAFPDMNSIYAPTNNDLDTASQDYSGTNTPHNHYPVTTQPTSFSPIARPSSVPPVSSSRFSDPMYHSGSDEFPASQIQALHPGGPWYPDMHSPESQKAEMSGARISADDFDGPYEESSSLSHRFGFQQRRV